MTMITRSNFKAQTSATLSLMNVKQTSQAWYSLSNTSLLSHLKVLWKPIHPFFSLVFLIPTDAENKTLFHSCIQGVINKLSEMFQIVHCIISDLSWSIHENPTIPFPVMLLTGTPPHLSWWPWESLVRPENVTSCYLCHARRSLKMSRKSGQLFFHNYANKPISRK